MTIEEKLFAIFNGSPLPVPELVGGVWQITAEQGALKPYLVITLVSSGRFFTQDEQANPDALRRWRFTFEVVSTDFLGGRSIQQKIQRFLTAYTDRPGRGIHRMLEITSRGGWIETERGFRFASDFDIVENLT